MTSPVYYAPARPSLGFDLIDLSDPLLHVRTSNHLRWITHLQDDFLRNTKNESDEFWYLWTAKEAVFKAIMSTNRFVPKEIPIKFSSDLPQKLLFNSLFGISGWVQKEGETILACCCYKCELNPPFIISMTHASLREHYSEKIKDYFIEKYNLKVSIDFETQIPKIRFANFELTAFSLSHHHRYFGFLYSF